MKFDDVKRIGNANNASELANMYLAHDMAGGSTIDFFKRFDFDTREEITKAVRDLAYSIVGDAYFGKKSVQDENVYIRSIVKRFNDIITKADKIDKYPLNLSGQLWNGYFSRKNLDERCKWLYNAEEDDNLFATCWETIKNVYSLSDKDMNKIHFFVEMVKAGADFPNSLRRMLYIWGTEKKTGKTTTANSLVCLLNGDCEKFDPTAYATTLANEMQIKSFAVPKVSECNVCIMDECFYEDMGKTYADFKRFVTTSNGRARLPYGQEFEWHGQPNYIATSNDSLQKFIKDWGDRRYLSIHFAAKPLQMSMEEVHKIWAHFVMTSRRKRDWYEWSNEISKYSDETGERSILANEFAIEMRTDDFLDMVLSKPAELSCKTSNTNKVSLKYFLEYFVKFNSDVRKRRGEIESAVIEVFGDRYNGTSYWLLPDLQETARRLKFENHPQPF